MQDPYCHSGQVTVGKVRKALQDISDLLVIEPVPLFVPTRCDKTVDFVITKGGIRQIQQ